MSEAAHSLSISDLLLMLSEKLDLGRKRIRQTPNYPGCPLESEIDSLEANARDILRLIPTVRNYLRPVNRLPPEVLSRIARCLITVGDADGAIAIVPLTHVCRYWRESIVSDPENWSLVSNRNKDMAALCLRRAKAVPLTIDFDTDRGPSCSDTFAPYLQNVRTLTVRWISAVEELVNLLPDFPRSTPSIRSLTLLADLDLDSSIDPFESFVPSLDHLSLTYIPLYPSLLKLRSLVELFLCNYQFDLSLDTLLDFLEQNRSLENVTLLIKFILPSLCDSQRRTPVKNQLLSLTVRCEDITETRALISAIPLQRGAHLKIYVDDMGLDTWLNDILPGISTAGLSDPPSSTFFRLERRLLSTRILLRGIGGIFTFERLSYPEKPLADWVGSPLPNVREARLLYLSPAMITLEHLAFCLSHFPALEALSVEGHDIDSLHLPKFLSNPSSSPSLKTLAFLNCHISEEFMEELTEFASERRNIPTSTPLYRVLIVHNGGVFPSTASIRRLENYVKVVDVRVGTALPTDLA